MAIFHKEANLNKLFTSQDLFHIHKIFGFLSICSFIYRYGYIYFKHGNLGLKDDDLSWVSMLIHYLSALTGIFFHVPRRRIPDKPMIIYEEYRLHAIIFSSRCFIVFSISVSFPDRPWYIMPLIVAFHHIIADKITSKYGTPGNTAVRSTAERLNTNSFYRHVSKLYSLYQFLAIASHIVYNKYTPDLAYNTYIAIQSSAFMMTLYRKKIVTGKGHLLVYLFCLFVSTYHIIRLLDYYIILLTIVTFMIRINTRLNKYFLWSCFMVASFTNIIEQFISSYHRESVLYITDIRSIENTSA